jgi:hypothetical protein
MTEFLREANCGKRKGGGLPAGANARTKGKLRHAPDPFLKRDSLHGYDELNARHMFALKTHIDIKHILLVGKERTVTR